MLPLKLQSVNVQHSTCTQYTRGNKLLKIPILAYIATMYMEQNCICTATMYADKIRMCHALRFLFCRNKIHNSDKMVLLSLCGYL